MNTDRLVIGLSGALVLASLVLARYVSLYWFALTAFVGADLVQSSITGFCVLAFVSRRLGVPAGRAFDS